MSPTVAAQAAFTLADLELQAKIRGDDISHFDVDALARLFGNEVAAFVLRVRAHMQLAEAAALETQGAISSARKAAA